MFKTIDYQGMISLDRSMVGQLQKALVEIETQLGAEITHAIHSLPKESIPPALPFNSSGTLKLSDALQAFAAQIRSIESSSRALVSDQEWKETTKRINAALWHYVESLDSFVVEIVQRVKQLKFDDWSLELSETIALLQDKLLAPLDSFSFLFHQLEELLWQFRAVTTRKNYRFHRILYFWQSLLDRSLLTYTVKSNRFLKMNCHRFFFSFDTYLDFRKRIEGSLERFERYIVFNTLDEADQTKFKKLYELIKLWHLNRKEKVLPDRAPVSALKGSFSVDQVQRLFSTYLKSLEKELYNRSRKIKTTSKETFQNEGARKLSADVIEGLKKELHLLSRAISRYREFFLETHPNPYVRTRFGFSEWVVGPEPVATKKMLDLLYDTEKFDKYYQELHQGILAGPTGREELDLSRLHREVQKTLHAMGQPLTSRPRMIDRAEKLLELVEAMQELTSFSKESVRYVGEALSEGMRVDWQYQTLFDFSRFHRFYEIHFGILGPIEQRQYLFRKEPFHEVLFELTTWVKDRKTHLHLFEIEQDMTDIQGNLQDFLGFVQRHIKEVSDSSQAQQVAKVFARQLMELRYLFGQFFHLLQSHEPEGKTIRTQFLFVDRYFEAIETALQGLLDSWR